MKLDVTYRGKTATTEDISLINQLIIENPLLSRTRLSQQLCKYWNWVQPNGVLRDMVCRGYLLELERAGYIKLPPRKNIPNNPFVNRVRPSKVEIETTPFYNRIKDISPLIIKEVRRSSSERVYNSLIEHYHYLKYCHPVGEHLKYIVYFQDRPLSCLAFSSSPRHIGCRDRFIGWDQLIRRKNIHLICYNTRFLILPWVHIPHLASHILGRIVRRISKDWQDIYNHPIYFLETFVDTERFKGTCYKAANWIYLGKTTGRGKNDQTNKPNRSIKAVWGNPLVKDFREQLNNVFY